MTTTGWTRGLGYKTIFPPLSALSIAVLLLAPVACGDDSNGNVGGKGGGGGASAAAGRGGGGGRGGGAGGRGGANTGSGGRGGSSAGIGGTGGAAGTGGRGGTTGSAGAAGSGPGAGGSTAGSGGSSPGAGGSTAGSGGSSAGRGGGSAGTGGVAGTGGSAGSTDSAGSAGMGGRGGGSAGSGGTVGAGGSGGGGGSGGTAGTGPNCALPPTDAGVPGAMPDSVVFLSNVTVTTPAGGATPGAANGAAGVGTFDNPVSIAIEASGSLAVSDFENDRLRRVVAADGTLSTLTQQNGFSRPYGLAVVGGVLYADTDNNPSGGHSATSGTIWRIDGVSGVATAVGVDLGRPRGLAGLSDGRLALADTHNQVVRLFDPTTGLASVLAGTPGCQGSQNGTGADARFMQASAVAVLAGDRIIVADHEAHILREVSLAGVVTTFAGDGVAGTIDGPRAGARFVGPRALAADASGAIFVSDDGSHRIRRIAANGTVTTVAGDGTGGFMDGPGNMAQFLGQEGIAVSGNGATIYMADGTGGGEPPGPYHRIRKITIGP